MLSPMVASKRKLSCCTKLTSSESWSSGMFLTSVPLTDTEPASTSQCLAISRASVDLPDPDGPTSAVNVPWGTDSDTPCKTSSPAL